MEIGIFAKTFHRSTLPETLDAVVAHGLRWVQFNFVCAGLPSMPDQIDPTPVATIRHELTLRDIKIAAVSGTFNMINPDLQQRRQGLQRLRTLASISHALGTQVITLSTGTRDAENMWRWHPANESLQAWRDLLAAMEQAVTIAEEYAVTLAFEPEVSNVVDTAQKGRQLLDEIHSPHLKVVMDGANLFHSGEIVHMQDILKEVFTLLGDDIVLAHAKDLSRDGEAGQEAAGQGLLDYDLYLRLLNSSGYRGPLILHGLTEDQVDNSVAFLHGKLSQLK